MGAELGAGLRGRAVDTASAVGVAGLVLADAALGTNDAEPLNYLLLTVGSLVLAVSSRVPRAVLLITTLCIFGYLLRVGPDVIAVVPVLIAVYAVVAAGHRLLAVVASAPFIIAAVWTNPIREGILPIGWFVAAGVLGEVARARRAYLHQVEQRAADAERTREETARRRAADERLRIARELHDSLTHSISIIKVQAGVAVHLARKRGDEVPEALLAIREASSDAVRELRDTLEVLRDPDDVAVVSNPPVEGTPNGVGSGLDRLPELVGRARSAGQPVTVRITGQLRTLPAEIDRAAYRIVQEALTNVTRHAGSTPAQVLLDYRAAGLTVRIDDDGLARTDVPVTPGVGLTGMRERVTALGGTLRAEPKTDGGFVVLAELPVLAEVGQ